MVSDDRKFGLEQVSKYFYILLTTLRKLKKYYSTQENKYLYTCINKSKLYDKSTW